MHKPNYSGITKDCTDQHIFKDVHSAYKRPEKKKKDKLLASLTDLFPSIL